MFETELLEQTIESPRPIHGVQVFALKILDDGKLELDAVIFLATSDESRHLGKAGDLRCPQAPLAADELVFGDETLDTTVAAFFHYFATGDDKRLKDAVHANGLSEIAQAIIVKFAPRLERIRLDFLDVNPKNGVAVELGFGFFEGVGHGGCASSVANFGNF
jgi:hypothetical protein